MSLSTVLIVKNSDILRHGVKVVPELGTPPQSLKVGPQDHLQSLKVGPPHLSLMNSFFFRIFNRFLSLCLF